MKRPAMDAEERKMRGEMSSFERWRDWAAVTAVTTITGAILGAWLAPGAVAGREPEWQRASCASNLRQLGAALRQYQQDNDGYLPNPGGTRDSLRSSWHYLRNEDGVSPVLDAYLVARGRTLRNLWRCPQYTFQPRVGRPGGLKPGTADYFRRFPRTYSMNLLLCSPGTFTAKKGADPAHLFRIDDPDAFNPALEARGATALNHLPQGANSARIPDPAKTVLLFEGIPIRARSAGLDGTVRPAGSWPDVAGAYDSATACAAALSGRQTIECRSPGLTPWHGKENVYLYCDGHVQTHAPVPATWRPAAGDPGEFLVRHCRDAAAPCP